MKHLISAFVAATVSFGVTFGAHNLWHSKPTWEGLPSDMVAVPASSLTPPARRSSPETWDGLTQSEVDALTEALKGMAPHPVAIFCTRLCDDLALDFDNAFESAHWESGIEHPYLDTNSGLNVAPKAADGVPKDMSDAATALADAITRSTNGRMRPGLVEAHIGDRLAIVISRKPR